MNAQDNLMEKIENGFGVIGGGNGKLEFTGMKSADDKRSKKKGKGLMNQIILQRENSNYTRINKNR